MTSASAATPVSRAAFFGGWSLILAGAFGLPRIDARAENLWSYLSCSAILLGYAALGASIFLRRD